MSPDGQVKGGRGRVMTLSFSVVSGEAFQMLREEVQGERKSSSSPANKCVCARFLRYVQLTKILISTIQEWVFLASNTLRACCYLSVTKPKQKTRLMNSKANWGLDWRTQKIPATLKKKKGPVWQLLRTISLLTSIGCSMWANRSSILVEEAPFNTTVKTSLAVAKPL